MPYDGSNNYLSIQGAPNFVSFTQSNPVGFAFGVRRSSTDSEFYLGGTSRATSSDSVSTTLPSDNIELFGADGANNLPISTANFFIFTDALSDSQVTTLTSIIDTFQTTLGRQA